MQGLSQKLIALLIQIGEQYIKSPSKPEQFKQNNPFIGKIAAGVLPSYYNELDLTKKKREQFQDLVAIFKQPESSRVRRDTELTSSTPQLDDVRAPSRASNLTAVSTHALSISDFNYSPNPAFLKKSVIKARQLNIISKAITEKINAVNALREIHPVGTAEGLLKAMRSSINSLMQIYLWGTKYLVENIDDVITESDPILQQIRDLAYLACTFAYDLQLAKYSKDPNGHIVAAKYYLGSGAQNLSIKEADHLLLRMHATIRRLTLQYNLQKVFGHKLAIERGDIAKENIDINLYLAKLLRVKSKDKKHLEEVRKANERSEEEANAINEKKVAVVMLSVEQVEFIQKIQDQQAVDIDKLQREFADGAVYCDLLIDNVWKALSKITMSTELSRLNPYAKKNDQQSMQEQDIEEQFMQEQHTQTQDIQAPVIKQVFPREEIHALEVKSDSEKDLLWKNVEQSICAIVNELRNQESEDQYEKKLYTEIEDLATTEEQEDALNSEEEEQVNIVRRTTEVSIQTKNSTGSIVPRPSNPHRLSLDSLNLDQESPVSGLDTAAIHWLYGTSPSNNPFELEEEEEKTNKDLLTAEDNSTQFPGQKLNAS